LSAHHQFKDNMKYNITPLATTTPHWETLIQYCNEYLGYSPTRGLDKNNLDMETPSSYLACLDLSNEPLKALSQGVFSKIFKHVSCSFIGLVSNRILQEIQKHADLEISLKYSDQEEAYVAIFTGDMRQWYMACVSLCQNAVNKDARLLFNIVLIYFEKAGYRGLWANYNKIYLKDESFILKVN